MFVASVHLSRGHLLSALCKGPLTFNECLKIMQIKLYASLCLKDTSYAIGKKTAKSATSRHSGL